MLSECIKGYKKTFKSIKKRFFKYKSVFYLVWQSVHNLYSILIECVWTLWAQRAQHKTGSLSSFGAKKSPNPHIKIQSRSDRKIQSRYSHISQKLVEFSSESLVEILIIIHHLIYCMCTRNQSRSSQKNLVETCHHMHTHTCISSRYVLSYVHTLRDTSCISVCTRSHQILSVGTI